MRENDNNTDPPSAIFGSQHTSKGARRDHEQNNTMTNHNTENKTEWDEIVEEVIEEDRELLELIGNTDKVSGPITMTENETVQTKRVEIGKLKGEISSVKVEVYSDFADGYHRISFRLSTVNYGESEIKRSGHTHPWGDNLTQDMEKYTADAHTAREEAWTELERRNLDNPDDWHDTSV